MGRPPLPLTEWGRCSDHGCIRPIVRRGMCNVHSLRYYKTGDPRWDVPVASPRRSGPLNVPRDILAHLVINPDTGCLTWPYATYSDGRGHIKEGQVHRIVYEFYHGPVPAELWILHRCGNGHLACADIDHLYAGTAVDNSRDAYQHGVMPLGESHPRAKLSNIQAIEIRRRALAGESQRVLADEFGVTVSLISMIKTNKIWRHL